MQAKADLSSADVPARPNRLAAAVEAALNRPEFSSAGRKFGFVPAYLPAAEFGSLIAREDQFLARQIQALALAKPR